MSPLSPRELEVLRRLCDGRIAKGVAKDMGLSEDTLKDYTARIRFKLGARTMPHAAAKAVRAGLV